MFYLLTFLSLSLIVFTKAQFLREAGQVTDFLTSFLIVLSFLVGGFMLRGRWAVKINQKNRAFFILVCVIIIMLLVVTFKIRNLLYFYVFFEAGLIPIFLLILG